MVKWVIIAVLLLPVAEIAVFILVVAIIGLLWAVLLTLATTLAGVLVLRRAGRGAEAAEAYDRALALVGNDAERRYLERRRAALIT